MKMRAMARNSLLGFLGVFSPFFTALLPTNAKASDVFFVTRDSAKQYGLNYQKISLLFGEPNQVIDSAVIYLGEVYVEDSVIDLSSMDGRIIRVPLAAVVDHGSGPNGSGRGGI